MIEVVAGGWAKAKGFLMRQKRNYRVAIARSASSSFLANLTAQYNSIYTVALGADSVQVGTISSIGGAISALISTPVGWLVDRYGVKRFYLLALALMAGGALIYGLAPGWQAIIAATILLSLGMRLTGTGCSVVCADSVPNEDRATAQNLCVSFSSIASVVAPLLGAYLITRFGGLSAGGIRPLYYLRFAGYVIIFVFLLFTLREPKRELTRDEGTGFVQDFRALLGSSGVLQRWVIVASLTGLPMAMTTPFLQLYAHEVKGADQYVIGAMSTAAILTRLALGIPLGRLADRIGRKKVVYLMTPLWYAANILLVVSWGAPSLIVAGAMQTFYAIASGITSAMTMELVPLDRMGRWSGLLGLFRGLVTIPAPLIGGLIWKTLGGTYVFLLPLAIDLLIRVPLFASIPETLDDQQPSH